MMKVGRLQKHLPPHSVEQDDSLGGSHEFIIVSLTVNYWGHAVA
jgi:hypothetical protein